MAKNPDAPKKPGKAPKSKAHRPEVQPIGPALAELLNPAINRGESGLGSGTGEAFGCDLTETYVIENSEYTT